MESLEQTGLDVAKKVRSLRQEGRWPQTELARRLDLSQSHLSELERGAGTFTAEQLLLVLRLFDVPASHFAATAAPAAESSLQNALARLGAAQLRERDRVVPSEDLAQVDRAVRETWSARPIRAP